MRINEKKSMCIQFGARHNVECTDLKFDQGGLLHWSSQCRYLGVYFVSGRALKYSFDPEPALASMRPMRPHRAAKFRGPPNSVP